jgi:hypothetical protein
MTRAIMIGLVIAMFGAFGLTVGWLASSQGRDHTHGDSRGAVKLQEATGPPSNPAAVQAQHEFSLGPEDVANDRETPAVVALGRGRVVLAWADQTSDDVRTLYLARSADGGRSFEPPIPWRKVPIYRFTSAGKGNQEPMSYSTHVLPRLASLGEQLFLGWVEAKNGGPEVCFYVASSADGGTTFSEPVPVHGKEASRPGFTTLAGASDGSLLTAWLDGRNRSQQPFFAARLPGSEGFEPEALVSPGPDGRGICPCCDLAVARLPDGAKIVAYRNTDSGHRDIWFARAETGRPFGPARPLAEDGWKFEGCPHDGPSLAVHGDCLYAAWMSAHGGQNRIYVARSPVTKLEFSACAIDSPASGGQGHPKLASSGGGKLLVVWDESLDATPLTPAAKPAGGHDRSRKHGHGPDLSGIGRAIMIAELGTDGRFKGARPVAARAGAFQLNPAVTIDENGNALIAWNELDSAGKRVVVVRGVSESRSEP